jgi:hypothetical protein
MGIRGQLLGDEIAGSKCEIEAVNGRGRTAQFLSRNEQLASRPGNSKSTVQDKAYEIVPES